MPNYKVNGKTYTIPEDKIDAFELDFPDAQLHYQTNSGKKYTIPASKRKDFLADFPDAQELGWKSQGEQPKKAQQDNFPMFDDEPNALLGANMPINQPQNQPEQNDNVETNFFKGLHQMDKNIWQAGLWHSLRGEIANLFTGSSREEQAALNDIEYLESVGIDPREYLANVEDAEFQKLYGMNREQFDALDKSERKRLSKDAASRQGELSKDAIKALEKERKQRQSVIDAYQDALAEAGGDLDKAKEILRAKAEDKTWGDEQIEKANAIYAENKELQGAAKWGGLAASAIPSAAALGLSFLTKGKTAGISKWLNRAAKLAGNVGMAGMSAGTAGLSMIEARQHGATNWETWTTGIADGLIEFITEKIPFDKLTKPVLTAAKTRTTKALMDAMRRVDSPGRKELEKLLTEANKKLGGKLLNGKNVADWLANAATEAVSEATAEALQTVTSMIYLNPEEYPTFSEIALNAWEGAKGGFALGGVLGGAGKAVEHSLNKDRRKQQGFVNVALVEQEGKNPFVAELVDYDPETKTYKALQDGEIVDVKEDEIQYKHQYTYNEFESGRYRQLEDEAIADGTVSDAQVAVSADRLGNARQKLENLMTEAGMTDEQKNATFADLESGGIPGFSADAKALWDAADEYSEAFKRDQDIQSAREVKAENERKAVLDAMTQQMGGEFWQKGSTTMQENGMEIIEPDMVEIGTMQDGKQVFILSTPNENGEVSAITEDGKKMFIRNTDLQGGTTIMPLQEYLDARLSEQKKVAEQARMAEEAAPQLDAIRQKYQMGVQVNLGTEDSPTLGQVIGIKPENDGVYIQAETGVAPYTYQQLADIEGTPIRVMTDAQMAAAEAAEIEAAESARRTELAETPEQMTEAETVIDNAVQMENLATETPLPLNPDGSVNQDALFKESPARWAEWNDERKQDGGASSAQYISGKLAKAQARLAELQTAYAVEDSLNKKELLEKAVAEQQGIVDELAEIMQKYAPAETAPVQTESVQPTPAATQQERTTESVLASLNDGTLTDEEIRANIEANLAEAQKAYDKYTKKAPKMGTDKDAYLAEKQKYEQGLPAMQQEIDFWNGVKQAYENAMQQAARISEEALSTEGVDAQSQEEVQAGEKGIGIARSKEDAEHVVNPLAMTVETRLKIMAETREAIHERVNTWSNKLGLRINVIDNYQDVKNEEAKENIAKGNETFGWFEKSTGEIFIYVPDYLNYRTETALKEVEKTILHEGIAHKGMREMLGEERYGELCDKVWNEVMTEQQRKEFIKYPGVNGDTRAAADEFIASVSENVKQDTVWDKIANFFKTALNYIGIETKVADDDLKGLLKQSYQRYIRGEASQQGGVSGKGSALRTSVDNLEKNGFDVDTKRGDVRFSSRHATQPQDAESIVNDIVRVTGRDKATAERWLQSEQSLTSMVLADKQYLDYVPDSKYSAIKSNSDYPQGTVDFNNICRKRLPFTQMYTRLQRRYPNRIFTADELADIRTIMSEDGLTVACGLCYVEDRRQMLGEVANAFINDLKDGFKTYAQGSGKKQEAAANLLVMIGSDNYVPTIYDLITLEGSDKLYEEHRGIWDAFGTYNRLRGQQTQNTFQGYAEYKREILGWSSAKVKKVNSLGGLRIFSYSDFEAHHLLDIVQIIIDCAAKGVMIQGYTKVPEFARAVARTGIKLNRSLIPLGDTGIVDGKLAYDMVEGIDINDPNFLEANDNVGNILIGINAEQIRLAMLDPFIDYIIPYHARQAGKIRAKLNVGAWENYIDTQNERVKETGKRVSDNINIYTDILGPDVTNDREFVEKYLAKCEELGRIPKFDEFLDVDENGKYVYTPGYYKFLVDFKLFDKEGNILPQKPVVAEFDDAFNMQILNDYAEGERQTTGSQMNETYDKIVSALGLDESQAEGNDVMFKSTPKRLTKNQVVKKFGGIWIEDKQEYAKFASAVNQNIFEKDGKGITFTDNHLYAYYWNIDGTPIPYVDIYLNADESQDIVNATKEYIEIAKGNEDIREILDSVADSLRRLRSGINDSNSSNEETSLPRTDGGLGSDISRKGKYADSPELYVTSVRNHDTRGDLGDKILFKTRTDSQREKLFADAKERFGVTDNFKVAGYMLPDGSLLDFSEANDGGDPNQRSLDHRSIEDVIMEDGTEYESRWMYLADFMNEGAIRLLPEYAGINLMKAPTKEQRQRLMDFIYKYNGEVILEIADERLNNAAYVEYDRRTSPARIFRDIDGYFNEGIVPQSNTMFKTANNNQAIFVSNAAKAVEGIKMEKATPEQWLKMIEKNGGLKAGEDKWMGLSDFLKSSDKKTLTKQDVLDFVNEHMIQIEEVHYDAYAEERASDAHSNIVGVLQNKFNDFVAEYHEEHGYDDEYDDPASKYAIEKLRDEMEDTFPYTIELVYGNEVYVTFDYEEEDEMVKWAEKTGVNYIPGENPINSTRLNYTTDGLENKHEIALTIPTIEPWNESDDIHFGDAGEGRAVAWIRFGETEVPTAEYKLLLDEMDRLKEVARELYEEFGGGSNELAEVEKRQEELRLEMRSYKNAGSKVLVIDEIQSKRHQEGREKGYSSDFENSAKLQELNAELEQKTARRKELKDYFDSREENELVRLAQIDMELDEVTNVRDYDRLVAERDEINKSEENALAEFDMLVNQINELEYDIRREKMSNDIKKQTAIPDAPFDKNWHELAMKRMLRYAAENGYDAIAWTKGDQQAERYDIGGVLEAIQHYESENGRVVIIKPHNNESSRFVVNNEGLIIDSKGPLSGEARALSDVVGKELAVRIMSGEGEEIEKRDGSTYYPAKMIKGDGIRIGSEGMKGFYDKMLPAFMNKYGKKWGVKVEDINFPGLEGGLTMHSVPVTEEMKESVMEGQTMFKTKHPQEFAKQFMEGVVNDFYNTYETAAPASVVYVKNRRMVEEALGFGKGEMPDWLYERVKEEAKGSGAYLVNMQFQKEDGTEENRRRILIFAKEDYRMSADVDRIIFHENTHGWILDHPELLELGKWLSQSDDKTIQRVVGWVKDAYKEESWANEMLSDYVGRMLSIGKGQMALDLIPDEYKPLLNNIYEKFGYRPEQEDGRRVAELIRDAETLQMRDSELGEPGSNKTLFKTGISPEVRKEMDVISATAIVNGNYMKAPNGKDSKLTPEQWAMVRTKNFKRWFGDWENDPANASKVVDENGEPMVVYHGTAGVINKFEDQQRSPGFWFTNREDVANGYAESASAEFGEEKNVISVFLNIRKPRVEDAHSEYPAEFALKSYVENDKGVYEVFDTYEEAEAYREANVPDGWVGAAEVGDQHDLVERAKELGHDGVVMMNMYDQAAYAETGVKGTQTNYVVLDANQIKSATDNTGEFSESEDIRFKTVYGGNRGYVGYSMSKRAAEARSEGRYPKTDFRKEYNVTAPALDLLEYCGIIDGSEWHHTSMYGNKTKFYGWYEDEYADIYSANKKEIDALAREFKKKTEEYRGAEKAIRARLVAGEITPQEELELSLDADKEHNQYEREVQDKIDAIFNPVQPDGSGEGTTLFKTTGTPTEQVVKDGLVLSVEDFTDLAGNIFSAMPEDVRRKVVENAARTDYDLKKATLQMSASLAEKRELTDEEIELAKMVAQKVEDAVLASGVEMTRPLTTNEALWMLYQSTNPTSEYDLIGNARKAVVANNLGMSQSQQAEQEKDADNIRFRSARGAASNSAAAMYNNEQRSAWGMLRETYQDMYRSVKSLMQAIEKATGKEAQSWENILTSLNALSSKNLADKKKYLRDFLTPMWDAALAIRDKYHKSLEQIERYLMVKHGLERNKVLAARDARNFYREQADQEIAAIKADKSLSKAEQKIRIQKVEDTFDNHVSDIEAGIDAKFQEFRAKDYGGLTALFSDFADYGTREDYESEELYQEAALAARTPKYATLAETELAAQQEVDAFEKEVDKALVDNLWKKINAATKETLRHQYANNMLTKEQYERVRDMFEFYVPLRGFVDTTAEDTYSYYVSGQQSKFANPLQGAKGRKTQAETPLGWIGSMAESAIQMDNKNTAKLALYYFAVNRPNNDVLKITPTWYEWTGEVDADGKKIFEPVYPTFNGPQSGPAMQAQMDAFESTMEQQARAGNAYKGKQRIDLKEAVIRAPKSAPEHVVTVKVAGEDYSIIINANPRAAQAINGMLNIDKGDNPLYRAARAILRFQASIKTSLAPLFWITNFMRDVSFALINTSIRNDAGYTKEFAKNYPKAFKVFSFVHKNRKAALGSSKYEKYYTEFAENGGITGYTSLTNNTEYDQMMKAYAKNARAGKLIKGIRGALEVYQDLGESFEQVSRFAAYITARESGKDISESIYEAKEVTINFNRKGSGKAITWEESGKMRRKNGKPLTDAERIFFVTLGGLSPVARSLFMFFNAGMQGVRMIAKLAHEHPGKSAAWAGIVFTMGLINAIIHALAEDDDEYLDMPDYVRRTNILIGKNGTYFKWSLPHEVRPFYAMADIFVQHAMGRKPNENIVSELAETFGEWMPINPFKDGMNAFTPDIIRPFVEIKNNKDFTGSPIYREYRWLTEDQQKNMPAYEKGFDSTSKVLVDISEILNDVSGGDHTDAGFININPAIVEHLAQEYGGGPLKLAEQFFKTIGVMTGDQEFSIRNTPFLSTFMVAADDRYRNAHTTELFKYYKGMADDVKRRAGEYKADKDKEGFDKFRASDDFQIFLIYRKYEKRDKFYNEQLKRAKSDSERKDIMSLQDAHRKRMIEEISNL